MLYYTFKYWSFPLSVILQEAYECLHRDNKEIKAKAISKDLRWKMKASAEKWTCAATCSYTVKWYICMRNSTLVTWFIHLFYLISWYFDETIVNICTWYYHIGHSFSQIYYNVPFVTCRELFEGQYLFQSNFN